jgi:hypothetical protein
MEINMTNFRDRLFVLSQLREKLEEAQGVRSLRTGYNQKTQRFAWNEYEEKVLLTEVNKFREMFGAAPVSMNDIQRADDAASGHIDYTQKFLLNCVSLIYGE